MGFDYRKPGEILVLDGAMGTVLQSMGLPPGGTPELLNLTDPDRIRGIHRAYLDAGSQVVYTNTFGANRRKLVETGHSAAEVVSAGVRCARDAVRDAGVEAAAALDIGPLGALLYPMGTVGFEEAYSLFREMVEAGAAAGADLIVIETMTDLYEAKAALLAAKEASDLPVFVTMSFDANGRTFTGCTAASMARTLEGLGADAIGFNCSLGPVQLAPLLRELRSHTRLPLICKPNAGLPDPVDGHYDLSPADFAAALSDCIDAGASIVGGCCGTSPEYLRAVCAAVAGKAAPPPPDQPRPAFVCTPAVPVAVDGVRVVGERINPTGKKRFQQALLEEDLDYILDVAVRQEDAGADLLDVNTGFPGVDEVSMLPRVVQKIQGAVSLPLMLDSSNPDAIEAGLRVYNGKAAVNSVNGDRETLERVLPLVKKYGAAVVGLTLDRNGVPKTAEERIAIAERILDAARSYGIPKEDLWIDCLTLTVSAQQEQAAETLKALRYVREHMGLQTVLGVSNISFGLPDREQITRAFLLSALQSGLTLPILNPNQTAVMDAVSAFRVLTGEDGECRKYIARFAGAPGAEAKAPAVRSDLTLEEAIVRGLRTEAGKLAEAALQTEDGVSLVERRLIPALDKVGEGYERGTVFLPQLLSAAQAAQSVFEAVRAAMASGGAAPVKKGKLIVATVRGDIHDIGKNIVKTVLENYGYQVLDLGRDVPAETVVETVRQQGVRLVGLSALMTTTLPSMEETIRQLQALPDPPTVFVGGAVLTPEYAKRMRADYYAKDARASVEIAREVLG